VLPKRRSLQVVVAHPQDMISAVTDENSPGASPQLLARIVDYINRSPDK
jgi:hypothetical protein